MDARYFDLEMLGVPPVLPSQIPMPSMPKTITGRNKCGCLCTSMTSKLYNSLYGFLSSLGRDEQMECIYSTEQCVLFFFACSVGDYQDIFDIKL
jgi:hypothetical protein